MADLESIDPFPLLYADTTEGHLLLLVVAEIAEDLFHARESLPHCRTWGDARRELAGKYFGELVDEFVGFGEEPPADDEPLDTRSLIAAGDWPAIYVDAVLEAEPDEILAQLTAPWLSSGHSGAFLVAKDRDDPIAFLQRSGVKCDEDTAILGLLAY